MILSAEEVLECFLVDAVERLGAIGLQVHEGALRPTTGLIHLGKGDALTHEASGAVEELGSLSDSEKFRGFHRSVRVEYSQQQNVSRNLPGITL